MTTTEEQPIERVTAYYHITGEAIAWTKEVVPGSVLIDIDKNGRIVGVETVGTAFNADVALQIIRAAVFSRD